MVGVRERLLCRLGGKNVAKKMSILVLFEVQKGVRNFCALFPRRRRRDLPFQNHLFPFVSPKVLTRLGFHKELELFFLSLKVRIIKSRTQTPRDV